MTGILNSLEAASQVFIMLFSGRMPVKTMVNSFPKWSLNVWAALATVGSPEVRQIAKTSRRE